MIIDTHCFEFSQASGVVPANPLCCQIDRLRAVLTRMGDVNPAQRSEAFSLMEQLKQKLESGDQGSEVTAIWQEVEGLLSDSESLTPFLNRIGRRLLA